MLLSLSKSATLTILNLSEWALLVFGVVLVIGLIVEYRAEHGSRWMKFGEILVILGVAGELLGDGGIFLSSRQLQIITDSEIAQLTKDADDAKNSAASAKRSADEAGTKAKQAVADSATALSQAKDALTNAENAARSLRKAENEANEARAASSSALALAKGAREEADSYRTDITSAMTLAAEAESHLREALKQAEDATAELRRLKTPRSLTNVDTLVSAMRDFKGTKFGLFVFQDEESSDLASEIGIALQHAEWQPATSPYTGWTGNANIRLKDFPGIVVSPTLRTGVHIKVSSEEKLEALQALPPSQWPQQVQAATALRSALASSIFPMQNDLASLPVELENFATGGTSTTVWIEVGKKP